MKSPHSVRAEPFDGAQERLDEAGAALRQACMVVVSMNSNQLQSSHIKVLLRPHQLVYQGQGAGVECHRQARGEAHGARAERTVRLQRSRRVYDHGGNGIAAHVAHS